MDVTLSLVVDVTLRTVVDVTLRKVVDVTLSSVLDVVDVTLSLMVDVTLSSIHGRNPQFCGRSNPQYGDSHDAHIEADRNTLFGGMNEQDILLRLLGF